MHSLNHFLINADPDETIEGAQQGQFGSYVDYKFDDNNWYTPLSLTVKGGETLISDSTSRGGFDAWVNDRDSWDFDAAMKSAYDCMYWDIGNDLRVLTEGDHNYQYKFESVDEAAQTIREALAASYAGTDDGIDKWRLSVRPNLAKTYEELTDKYFTPPFFNAYRFSPYTARTFDLTDGDDFGLAILTVDVHT